MGRGSRLIEAAREIEAFMSGARVPGMRVHIPADYDIKAIRKKLGLTQAAFAARYSFNLASVRDWEQQRAALHGKGLFRRFAA